MTDTHRTPAPALIWLGERDAALYPGVHWHMLPGYARFDPSIRYNTELNTAWHNAHLPPA